MKSLYKGRSKVIVDIQSSMALSWDQFLSGEADRLGLLSDKRAVFLLWYASQKECLTQEQWMNEELYRSRANPDDWLRNQFREIYTSFRNTYKDRDLPSKKNTRDILHRHLRELYAERILENIPNSVEAYRINKELWGLLDKLDFESQTYAYNTERKRINPTLGCLVKSDDNYVQFWLIKRLVQKLNILGNPQNYKHFLLDAYNPILLRCGVGKIWNTFLEEDMDNDQDQEAILNAIRKKFENYLNNNKTVLITVFGIERISNDALKGLHLVWKEAIKLNSINLPSKGEYSKIFLFLSQGDENGLLVNLEPKVTEIDNFLHSMLKLDSFEICSEDWIDWLKEPACKEQICEVLGEDGYGALHSKSCSSRNLLDDIARIWGISGGFAEYKIAWDLNYVA